MNSNFEIFKKYLLEGNTAGTRSILQASFVEMLVDDKKRRPIHWVCHEGFSEIAKLLIEHTVNLECEDEQKMRPIHWACHNGHSETAKLLIEHAVNLECENGTKKRPIHWACLKGHSEIAKLLIQNGVNVECKDGTDSSTPLDLARTNGHEKCVELIKETIDHHNKKIFDCVRLNDNATLEKLYTHQILLIQECNTHLSLLDVAIQTNADRIIKYLLDRKVVDEELSKLPHDLSQLTQEFMLYRCIRDNHNKGFELMCSADVINGPHGIIQSTFLELAAEHGSQLFVNEIVKKSLYNKDSWQRAKTIANEKGHNKIVEIISEREFVINFGKETPMSILHTAVSDNAPDMVQYILDNHLVDLDINNERFGTALALAYSFRYRKCIEILEQFKANPNTCNKYSETPLHEAIASGMVDNCEYLIERAENIDVPGFMGFTALHSAVMMEYSDLCSKLARKGANCNRYIELSPTFSLNATKRFTARETPGTLCLKTHGTIYPCIMDKLDKRSVNFCDDHNNSLLHLSVQCIQPDICKHLIDIGSMIDPINDNGNTPLLEILSLDSQAIHDNIDEVVTIVHLLTESGADINKVTNEGSTVFQCAAKYRNERLMLALMTNKISITNISEDNFKLVFQEKWYNFAEIFISTLNKHSLLSYITTDIFNLTMSEAPSSLIKLLYNHADTNVQKLVIENILLQAVEDDNDKMFSYLITEEICSPKLLENGETLLTTFLKSNKMKYCDKLLQSRNDKHFVNLRNAQGQTPLQVALEMEHFDLADNLVLDSNDLNIEDNNGNTALRQLFTQISNTNDSNIESRLFVTIKSIISHGGDIYQVTSNNCQVIHACTNQSIRSNIERFANRKQRGAAGPVVERIIEVEKKICLICTDREVDGALKCGHTFCMQCCEEFVRCPVCNAESTKPRKIFLN